MLLFQKAMWFHMSDNLGERPDPSLPYWHVCYVTQVAGEIIFGDTIVKVHPLLWANKNDPMSDEPVITLVSWKLLDKQDIEEAYQAGLFRFGCGQ